MVLFYSQEKEKRVSIWLRQYDTKEQEREKKKGAGTKKKKCMSILAKGLLGIGERDVVYHNNQL
jgi:hypothetical protein